MQEQMEKMQQRLARQLGQPEGDAFVQDALQEAADAVCSYCGIEEIPKPLESVVVRIARDIWRAAGYGGEEAAKEVKAVSRGDVSTSFEAVENSGSAFVKSYQAMLNPYRKLGW